MKILLGLKVKVEYSYFCKWKSLRCNGVTMVFQQPQHRTDVRNGLEIDVLLHISTVPAQFREFKSQKPLVYFFPHSGVEHSMVLRMCFIPKLNLFSFFFPCLYFFQTVWVGWGPSRGHLVCIPTCSTWAEQRREQFIPHSLGSL